MNNMDLNIEIPYWRSHFNMILYSIFYYSEMKGIKLNVKLNSKIRHGVVLFYKNHSFFFDYSDDTIFSEQSDNYDFYFKRSLKPMDLERNIYPLNFQINSSFKSFKFISKLNCSFFLHKQSRTEIIRALDYFSILTNLSHNPADFRKAKTIKKDNQGRVIFQTRLWDPATNPDQDEKERRAIQNSFRIGACRIIKKNFPDSTVGLYPDDLAKKMANDVLLDKKDTSKINYLRKLNLSSIAIADDGLKGTPGWKIGEYALNGKAIISTPINTVVENFEKNINYLELSHRSAFEELPDLISDLIANKAYLKMGAENELWASKYVSPENYFSKILEKVYLV